MGIFCKIASMFGFGPCEKEVTPEPVEQENEDMSQVKSSESAVQVAVSSAKKYVLIGAGPASVRAA